MKAEVSIYEYSTAPLERIISSLMEKVLAGGKRAVIVAPEEERVEQLTTSLWTLGKGSFIPHGTKKDGFPEDQPIWLSDKVERPNDATVLVLVDGISAGEQLDSFEKCLELVDGRDTTAVSKVNSKVDQYQAAGHTVTYWVQGANGWQKRD
ncbi:MAG: DNA polymerase III subunit chi [Alphaproteobacteria bacterium]